MPDMVKEPTGRVVNAASAAETSMSARGSDERDHSNGKADRTRRNSRSSTTEPLVDSDLTVVGVFIFVVSSRFIFISVVNQMEASLVGSIGKCTSLALCTPDGERIVAAGGSGHGSVRVVSGNEPVRKLANHSCI